MVAGGVIGSSIIIIIFIFIYYFLNNQLNTVTAYGTIISAMANLFLVLVTWRYLGEVHEQVNIMADAGKSSKMRENNRDLSDAMTKLIAPLYFRKSEEILFGKTTRFLRSRSAFDDNARVYFNFWDSIETNMHLA